MLPLSGYADRLSARPGETITFRVASAAPWKGGTYSARLVRVICGDPNPAGPGMQEVPVAAAFDGEYEPLMCHPRLGSYAHVASTDVFRGLESFTVLATIWPSLITGRHALVSTLSSAGAAPHGLTLAIDAKGGGTVTVALAGGGTVEIASGHALRQRVWARVWASFDQATRELVVGQAEIGRDGRLLAPRITRRVLDRAVAVAPAKSLLFAAEAPAGLPAHQHCFNGKLESPAIFSAVLATAGIDAFARDGKAANLVAHWDFAREMQTQRIVDVGPGGHHGRLVAMPTRAMTGSRWTGREMCWRHAPAEYACIHFHEDDIYDAGFPDAFSWTIPAGTRSGVYAVRIEGKGPDGQTHADNIPIFVVPPKGKPKADICVIMPVFTYVIYHNNARLDWDRDPAWRKAWEEQAAAWQSYPHNPGNHREYGLSTYNFHTDGSGVAYCSWLRPMMNVRLGYFTYPDPAIRGSGLRHLPADTHLLAWLEAKGYDYDIITDHELDTEGYDVVAPYRVVLTGSHPEYHTRRTLDALQSYRDGGGRLMYLGGNGFYWKVARSEELPAAIEIRRGEGGIRAWAAEVGEYYNAFDGEYGGLWRRNGRPPQDLAGVGFTAQGNFIGSYYKVRPEARGSRASWMLAGVNEERIGDFGLSGNGAAGFELDRADTRLGTPAHAIVLAQSEDHKPEAPWVLVHEDQLTHIATWTGDPIPKLIRADMVFFEAPNDGAVFAVGSITFCGSLPSNNFDNNISRLLGNVLDRFRDPAAKFPLPTES